ncbi:MULTISPECIES: hypothetical protein [Paenibacillus]|uniref:hypothetical protein n=1 Tax=Paenibacillus TaxID=44249 RepID=UPI0022B8C514|nr:hypothetical protein [Paenibacillus caseinilyticus]MCZ8520984.1 hypothetical protein [Paenibacillus caseinilyticus]
MRLVNKIEVALMKSEYCKVEHHNIVIDDTALDLLLNSYYPSNHLLGMIPTIIDWIDNPREKELIKERFNSTDSESVLPIMMCPDECDLWCTVIVAEVIKADGYITWKHIGIDKSTREDLLQGYDSLGTKVDWLDKIPPMIFEESQYTAQLSQIYF